MKKFIIKSMGCKTNQFEGDVIRENLINNGYTETDNLQNADIYILNSCSVTHKSDNEALYLLRNAKHLNNNITTVITGCVAQIEKENLLKENYIDYVIGNDEKLEITKFLDLKSPVSAADIMNLSKFHIIDIPKTSKTRVFLKIQDGCDNRCSYCIIPFARGKSRYADVSEVISRIKTCENNGFKEIVLTGIHIGQWGLNDDKSLVDLLFEIEKNCNIRYRLGSLNPLEITDNMLDFLSNSKYFCPHFHLSLQSACNRTLERMNRFYKVEDYLKQIDKINDLFKLPFLGSDIIAGFAGETEDDFNVTVNNLKKSGLTAIHTFPYSIRKGTKAENMDGHLSDKIKNERADIIKEISKEKLNIFLQKNIGTKHQLLVEKHLDKQTGMLKGITENYITVILNNNDRSLMNTIQSVEITEIKNNKVYGNIYH